MCFLIINISIDRFLSWICSLSNCKSSFATISLVLSHKYYLKSRPKKICKFLIIQTYIRICNYRLNNDRINYFIHVAIKINMLSTSRKFIHYIVNLNIWISFYAIGSYKPKIGHKCRE